MIVDGDREGIDVHGTAPLACRDGHGHPWRRGLSSVGGVERRVHGCVRTCTGDGVPCGLGDGILREDVTALKTPAAIDAGTNAVPDSQG